ncbi:HEAT repeat domain-containing protein [[Phormidium] sp. ETS-05]|uniref:HEAT repeat domain-containing protein n=1 Tax=[Phormidium] sp. ETS-05 TaxID=222819 RepID=UPI0018EF2FEF|nr:HEAT repeat domain-containing protein [[Phormidium] sp. ETS-05]
MLLTNPTLIEEAYSAAAKDNWSLVMQCLQQFWAAGAGMKLKPQRGRRPQGTSDLSDQEALLELALKVLVNGDFQERWEVASFFPKLGNVAISPLLAILEDERADLDLRWFAGRILSQFEDPAVVAALVLLLDDDGDEELSEMATLALANIGDQAIASLAKLLEEPTSVALAVSCLERIRSSGTIGPLLQVVNHPDSIIRTKAIDALHSFDDPRIPPVLVAALNDTAAPVRKSAVIGLGLCCSHNSQHYPPDADLVQLLKARLWDFNLEVCQQAAIALSRLGTDTAAAAIFELFQSVATPVPLQVTAARSLHWMATPTALKYLEQILCQTRETEVFREIITGLGLIESAELTPIALQIITPALQNYHPHSPIHDSTIKISVAWAIASLTERSQLQPPELTEALHHLLTDPDTRVQLHVRHALGLS